MIFSCFAITITTSHRSESFYNLKVVFPLTLYSRKQVSCNIYIRLHQSCSKNWFQCRTLVVIEIKQEFFNHRLPKNVMVFSFVTCLYNQNCLKLSLMSEIEIMEERKKEILICRHFVSLYSCSVGYFYLVIVSYVNNTKCY